MCTHITMDLKCTNIYNDLYTYQNGFTMYKDTQWCVHISKWVYDLQTYTIVCTQYNGCTMYKYTQWYVHISQWMYKHTQGCVHISQWIYNLQTYTMMCTHITMDVQCTNIHNDWFDFDFWCFNTTFSNISAISWRPVLVVEEAGVPGENHRPWASNW